ncbi:Hpt domain-containing protein [Desulfovibrio sp. OttesenSCG-928-A18]|nr:Hpt domain-containing protein [Desulfovibrio sp. OttesenSCG-928-A18]
MPDHPEVQKAACERDSAGTVQSISPSGAAVVLHMAEAVERMGDKEIYLEIARYFATNLPQSMERIQASLKNGEYAEASRFAHSLKGNCATVGAEELREQCLTLEKLARSGDIIAAQDYFDSLAPRLLCLRDLLLSL